MIFYYRYICFQNSSLFPTFHFYKLHHSSKAPRLKCWHWTQLFLLFHGSNLLALNHGLSLTVLSSLPIGTVNTLRAGTLLYFLGIYYTGKEQGLDICLFSDKMTVLTMNKFTEAGMKEVVRQSETRIRYSVIMFYSLPFLYSVNSSYSFLFFPFKDFAFFFF